MLVEANETSECVADDLNASFLAYEGSLLDLTEFTLLSSDDICPKSKWNKERHRCGSELDITASSNWLIIMLSCLGFVLMVTLIGTIYFFLNQIRQRPKLVKITLKVPKTIFVIK